VNAVLQEKAAAGRPHAQFADESKINAP